MNNSFKKEHTLEHRSNESSRILAKYPARLPLIVESKTIKIDKRKFLVPSDLTIGQFVYVIRKRVKLKPEDAIFIFINGTLPATTSLISQVYEEHKDEDNFLYVQISQESTFRLE